MKYIGSCSNLSESAFSFSTALPSTSASSAADGSADRPNCCSSFRSSLVFFTSNDPHSVPTPCSAVSSDICDRSVVFPDPVAPVSTDSSPLRSPLIAPVREGSEGSGTPAYWSGLHISCRTDRRRSEKVAMRLCGMDPAESSIAPRSAPARSASLASFGAPAPWGGWTDTTLFTPSLFAKISAPSWPGPSASIQRIMRSNRSSIGRTSGGKLRHPLGTLTAGRPVA
mmetsp:Transcript_11782/g.23487  ORF Transcript_11782/g.23487 Transcript_11782/m.23487 type:complete len:226 (-) Transcript_11782:169-846(-)